MRTVNGWAAHTPGAALAPWRFQRRELRPTDVALRVTHAGVCFTDLDAVRPGPGHVRPELFPLVPGHEIVGEAVAVGSAVTAFAVGDPVCVGNIVDSCGACEACRGGDQEFCVQFPTLTYAGRDRHDGSMTQGGFSDEYVADQAFVYRRPATLDPAGTAPLMCAGITTWVPLRRWEVGPGQTVGVIGLGGLGHVAVKLAKALGAEVVGFTTSPAKAKDLLDLGADDVVLSGDAEAMAAQRGRFDFILDTVPRPHDLSPYLTALRFDRTLCTLGIVPELRFDPQALLFGRKRLAGAGSGGIAATQEMLDFCAANNVTATVEVLPIAEVNTALDRLAAGDVRYRFVLEVASRR
ncbi:NAD(P)-dependent alcohol dehydrogenase [Catenulispora sp. NF23]|uniref:alcohol dehydrogenase (NADP(+)) n=1 Tax=Catenulispora pinistramenti TaxID=2705254 RepID=A0ABS5L678_9ACTN|nr:NAD(P)-dependent alcohol dehydrogenase [Catenulispora pinistramenti]MBS2539574.1 NAD(P)-dependent alcohol dehydrogenase [Catenulispora pinistramenti]MBS2553846.1 NAD(P)-dependent alcohol dehydrogenase [Catenulispora pinistramenti]